MRLWMLLLIIAGSFTLAACDQQVVESPAPAGQSETSDSSDTSDLSDITGASEQEEPATGEWIVLFDGTSLDGWKNLDGSEPPRAFQIDDSGALHRHQGGGDIYYDEVFDDFVFEADWKVEPHTNSGIFIRVNKLNEVWQTGLEHQVLDNTGYGDKLTSAASIYGLVPAATDVTNPVGEWNHARIVANDNIVQSYLNDVLIAEMDLDDDQWSEPVSKFPYPWKTLDREGYIVLQDHGHQVWYRDIRVKPLE